MNDAMKRNRIVLLIMILTLVFSFAGKSFTAHAATDGITQKLESLKTKFPNGKYWNHLRKVSGDDGDTLMYNFDNSYGDSVTDHPCAIHGGTAAIGQYDCNAFDGAIQCYGFANKIFYEIFGQYCHNLTRRTDKANISIGDHIRFTEWGGNGHSAIVTARNGDTLTLVECNWGGKCIIKWGRTVSLSGSNIAGFYHATNWQEKYNGVRGKEMTAGYDRVLPDGNYMIAHAGDTSYFLDIKGYDVPAANGTNVQIFQTTTGDIPDSDAWTITYSNGFYKVAQYGQAVSLDVSGGDTLRGKNVQAWSSNDSASAQKWAISRNGNNGYRLEAKCSGYSLDIDNGTIADRTNVQQWADNSTNAQSWVFIPYKPSQPVAEGRYILLYTPSQSYELDVSGDTGSISDGTNVQLWSDTALSRYNSFDLTKLDNGYYKLKHAASGKYLTVTGGSTAYKANVEVRADNGSNAQQWAVVSNGAGYSLISKANGYALDLPDGTTGNGKNLQVYPRTEGTTQRWTFVQAEHTVRFNANGGSGAPSAVTKYYKNSLTLPTTVPVRSGYRFLGWSASSGAATPSYSAGGTYTADNDITLYAVWESLSYTLSFDMNGGTGSLDPIHVTGGTCTIPDYTPQRTGYDFLGWSTNRSATTASYHAGDTYSGGTATLYAVWRIQRISVIFDFGDGDVRGELVEYGKTLGSLPTPQKEGYFFKGWFTSSGEQVSENTVVTEKLYLTTRWTESSKMVLPDNTAIIEDEAFTGTAAAIVIIPDKVTSIGAKAFAGNDDLFTVVVYSRSLTIADDAFENCPNLTVYGYSNSSIDTYCSRRGIPFVALEDTSY